jgi:hypothetical protein
MENDKLIDCNKCGGNCCYKETINEGIETFFCYGCGFLTNSLMKEGGEFLTEQKLLLPNIYLDLMVEDDQGRIWMPSTFNKPEQGMVYVHGTNVNNWKWRAIKAIKVDKKEKKKFPIPNSPGKYYSHKMDTTNFKDFDPKDFVDALDFVGVFENILEE